MATDSKESLVEFFERCLKDAENALEKTTDENKKRQIEWLIDDYRKKLEEAKRREEADKKIPPEERPGYALNKWVEEQEAKGEIINPFIKQHLEAKIITARWSLAIGIAVTFLFKGQWILWIVFVCMYCLYVNKAKKEAIEADRKNRNKKK